MGISDVIKHTAMIVGFAVGAVSIVGGVATQWGRLQPQLKVAVPQLEVTIAAPSVAEKQRIQKESAELSAMLTAFANQYPGQIAVAVTDLATGATASVNGDLQMVSASLYKLFVAYGIYQKIDTGEVTLTSPTTGSASTIGECLRAMIIVSDNDCGYALGQMVGWAQLDDELARLGYLKTELNNYHGIGDVAGDKHTSADDVMKFIAALYRGELLSAASTDAFLGLLKADQLNTWLPSGLPEGTVIAHKTGALYDLVHDAGVVYNNKGDYAVVVMTKGWQNPVTQPPPVFANISRQLWDFFNK